MAEVWFPREAGILTLSYHVDGSAAHPTYNPVATEILYQGVKKFELEADYMPPINVKTKNVWRPITSYALCLHCIFTRPFFSKVMNSCPN
jgi:hypothetical protein